MKTKRPTKYLRLRRFLVAGLLALFWGTGVFGTMLRPLLFRTLPRQWGDFTLVRRGTAPVMDPESGAVLEVSEPRLRKLAHDLLGWKAYLIPPGLIPHRQSLSGTWSVALDEESDPVDLPLLLRISPNRVVPILRVRLPSDLVNGALDYDGSFVSRSKRRSYFLGHYETVHWIRFDTAKLTSELSSKERARPVTYRRISGQATGAVRFRVKENLGRATITSRVRRMELRCDLEFKRYLDGLSMTYRIRIPELDADIPNLAPMFEGRPVEALRKLLEESMARPRKLERLARRRFPHGIPLDLTLDVEVFESKP